MIFSCFFFPIQGVKSWFALATRQSRIFFFYFYCAGDRRKCESIVPLAAGDADDDDGEMRAFFDEIFFWAGCKRLRSFRKSIILNLRTEKQISQIRFLYVFYVLIY